MRGYGQFCPVAMACEVFAERWTPLVLRELVSGSRRFNDIHRGVPLMSRTLLARRLRALEDAGVLEGRPLGRGRGREYRLTPAGEEFGGVIARLGRWGQRWARGRTDPENLDVALLMWDVRRRVAVERLPRRRLVVRFDFRGVPARCRGQRTFWLVLDRPHVDLCLKDPGFPVELVVGADLAAFTRVWLGDVSFAAAVRAEEIRLDGPRALVRAFPAWLRLGVFAGVERPLPARAG